MDYRDILPIPATKETIDFAAEAIKHDGPIHIVGGKGPHLLRDKHFVCPHINIKDDRYPHIAWMYENSGQKR